MSGAHVRIEHSDPQRPGRAKIWLEGVEIGSILTGYSIHSDAGKKPTVTFDIQTGLLRVDSTATARLTKRTRDVLTALGWTPPAEREG
jgi:hypothetical protein